MVGFWGFGYPNDTPDALLAKTMLPPMEAPSGTATYERALFGSPAIERRLKTICEVIVITLRFQVSCPAMTFSCWKRHKNPFLLP